MKIGEFFSTEAMRRERPGLPPLRATLRRPAGPQRPPLVIVVHGFKGFRDWGFFPHVGEGLARRGLASACVELSMNGIGDSPGVFTRPDLFEQNSLAREVDDTRDLLDLLAARSDLDPGRVGLLGHSRGGAIALLVARAVPAVRAVAGWAAVADWGARFPAEEWERYEAQGFLEVLNARTGQTMRIGRALLADLRDPRFDPLAAAAALDRPLLLVHGTADESVAVADSERLAAARGSRPTELLRIAGAGHTLGAVHPFAGATAALEQALAATIDFFLRVL